MVAWIDGWNAALKMHKRVFFFSSSIWRCTRLRADLTDLHVSSYLSVMTLSGVYTHTHPYDLLFIPISSPRREWWSQEQCKLGKMFWKVAFPAGTSRLQLWVKTLCVCVGVGVRAPIVLLVLECMKVCVCPDVHVCLLFPISHRLRWAVILGLVESETKRESVWKIEGFSLSELTN